MTILHINISNWHTLSQFTKAHGKLDHKPDALGSYINQCRPLSSLDRPCPTSLPGRGSSSSRSHPHSYQLRGFVGLGPQCTAFPCKAKLGGSFGNFTEVPKKPVEHQLASNQVGLRSNGFFCLSGSIMWVFYSVFPLLKNPKVKDTPFCAN